MSERSKYDTNPLDPEPARRAAAAWGDDATQPLGAQQPTAEASTRRYAQPQSGYANDGYASVYQQNYQSAWQQPPAQTPYPNPVYPPAPPTGYAASATPTLSSKPTNRTVPGLNLPENILSVAPYIPIWYLGAAAGLVILFVTPRTEKRIRFLAAQGLAMQLAFIIASSLAGVAAAGNGVMKAVSGILSLAMFIFSLVYLIKVWKGQDQPLEVLAQPTTWLEEQIAPKAKG